MSYEVKLDIFEGPLDLLLYLIKKNEINIYDIPIAYITEQYLQYIDMMRALDINVAGDYLVMAATLMQIKSRMLLPTPQEEEGEQEDPRKELVDRLVEYQLFKELAKYFREREEERQDWFSRRVFPEVDEVFEPDEIVLANNVFELLTAFSRVLHNTSDMNVVHEIVMEHYTVEEKIHELLHLLLDHRRIRVNALFARARSRLEIVAIFLAVLELVRLGEVLIRQSSPFGDIELYRNEQVVLS